MNFPIRFLIVPLALGLEVLSGQPYPGFPGKLPEYARDSSILAHNPTYSTAILLHMSPTVFLADQEAGLSRAESEPVQFLRLPFVAMAALEAGGHTKAEEYANRALKLATQYGKTEVLRNGRPYGATGDAIFYSHLVLGRIALLRNETGVAKNHLLLAGATGGSPHLSVNGPNMTLARELLKRSESETVLTFLEECKAFWEYDRHYLDWWAKEIRSGNLPEFGRNLFH